MRNKNIEGIISELEIQFPDGFEKYDAGKVEDTCRTCMFLGQFAAPHIMNDVLKQLKDKFPTGFDKEAGNTVDVANEFLRLLKETLNSK